MLIKIFEINDLLCKVIASSMPQTVVWMAKTRINTILGRSTVDWNVNFTLKLTIQCYLLLCQCLFSNYSSRPRPALPETVMPLLPACSDCRHRRRSTLISPQPVIGYGMPLLSNRSPSYRAEQFWILPFKILILLLNPIHLSLSIYFFYFTDDGRGDEFAMNFKIQFSVWLLTIQQPVQSMPVVHGQSILFKNN